MWGLFLRRSLTSLPQIQKCMCLCTMGIFLLGHNDILSRCRYQMSTSLRSFYEELEELYIWRSWLFPVRFNTYYVYFICFTWFTLLYIWLYRKLVYLLLLWDLVWFRHLQCDSIYYLDPLPIDGFQIYFGTFLESSKKNFRDNQSRNEKVFLIYNIFSLGPESVHSTAQTGILCLSPVLMGEGKAPLDHFVSNFRYVF